jgi:hypothetical protein
MYLMPLSAHADDEPCYVTFRTASFEQDMAHLRTVAAAVVATVQAPPAIVFLHERQCQMPTAVRLTESC